MAKIDSKVVFVTTSPRTPAKMIPEIELLNKHFSGCEWNKETQIAFMEVLNQENYFHGKGANDPSFSARDRINRGPKSLGFITLKPVIKLTDAGVNLINSKRKDEAFLRQLLKFQLPSPYHTLKDTATNFWIKPYLELFRLIHQLGTLSFDELRLFGLQLTDYRNFNVIVNKIKQFRTEKKSAEVSYKKFYYEYLLKELRIIYADQILEGKTKTRETNDVSIDKFLQTKSSNLRDYADACFRYLSASGLVNISHVGKTISIVSEKAEDVDHFLSIVSREPCYVDDEKQYIKYLGNAELPILYTDNRAILEKKIKSNFPNIRIRKQDNIWQLKELYAKELETRKVKIIQEQVDSIKNYSYYEDIQTTFTQLLKNSFYDNPLIFEWNTWRAMTMLNGGKITANLKFDDYGNPMSTAQGNMADIICDYGDFGLTVEVTLQTGLRQYETEGEPVTRHLAKFKKEIQKPSYCLFIAPKINEACIAHFFALHKLNISYYGGYTSIVPLPLSIFIKMLEVSFKANFVPEPNHIKRFFDTANNTALVSNNEVEWYESIKSLATNWLENN